MPKQLSRRKLGELKAEDVEMENRSLDWNQAYKWHKKSNITVDYMKLCEAIREYCLKLHEAVLEYKIRTYILGASFKFR